MFQSRSEGTAVRPCSSLVVDARGLEKAHAIRPDHAYLESTDTAISHGSDAVSYTHVVDTQTTCLQDWGTSQRDREK